MFWVLGVFALVSRAMADYATEAKSKLTDKTIINDFFVVKTTKLLDSALKVLGALGE